MSKREAFSQSIPFGRQGSYDDGSFSVAGCLTQRLIPSLLELVIRVGVGLAYTKLVIGCRNDTVAAVSVAEHCAQGTQATTRFRGPAYHSWARSPVVLGKLTVLSSMIAKDTPARIAAVVLAIQGVIAGQGRRHLASFEAIRSIIGVLIFHGDDAARSAGNHECSHQVPENPACRTSQQRFDSFLVSCG